MKLLKYIWRNIARNKTRSLLTVLSIGFSLALMTILHGYMAINDAWGKDAVKYNRIVVMSAQGLAGPVPIAYVDKVRSMPNVKAAVPYSWFGGAYEDEKMPFAQFGTDPKYVFDVWDNYKIPPEQLKAFQENRRAVVVDQLLAERRKWKLGDRIRLKGTFNPVNLDLELVGFFDAGQRVDTILFNQTYLDEALKQQGVQRGQGNAGTIFAKINEAKNIPDVSAKIDTSTQSSESPTRTQTEQAFAESFVEMQGDIRFYILVIGFAVVFMLILVSACSMAMSVRERTTEIAVLKAIGFQRIRILQLVIGESCLIALIGGILGIGLGCGLLETAHNINAQLVFFSISQVVGPWLFMLVGLAGCIGLVSGLIPAIIAANRSVIDGLRRVI